MYGGKIINEGKEDQFNMDDFANAYQNDKETGKRMFIKLWLHAYKYTFKDITIKSPKPKWVK